MRAGLQWPCNEPYPDGRERHYADGVFHPAVTDCEAFGHDLATGAAITPEEFPAREPRGRAIFKAAGVAAAAGAA